VEDIPEVMYLSAVWASAADDVWVAADSGRMLHFDGAGWETIELGAAATILDLWAFAPDDAWGVGGSALARYDGDSWEITDLSQAGAGISSVVTLWGTSPDDVWVAGEQSTAAHFDGTTWTRHLAAGPDNAALWGAASDDVYVGSVFATDHWDGTQWVALEELDHGASAIWGSGADDVWIADDSDLSHFDGGAWETTELEGLGSVSSMWGTSPDDIWGVGDFGSVVHFDGEGWRTVQSQAIGSPYLRSFIDVHGSSRGDVWAVGAQYGEDGTTPQLFHHAG